MPKKPGRKKSDIETVRYTVIVPKTWIDALEARARKYGTDKSVLTRFCIKSGVDQL